MIRERKGNIARAEEPLIVCLAGFFGDMENGIARQIREHMLTQEEYEEYRNGIINCEFENHVFRNCRNGKYLVALPIGGRGRVDLNALIDALVALKQTAHFRPIAIPAYLGYEEGHEETYMKANPWDRVFSVIFDVFADYRGDVTIYYNEEEVKRLESEYKQLPVWIDEIDDVKYIRKAWHGFPTMTRTSDIAMWLDATFRNSDLTSDVEAEKESKTENSLKSNRDVNRQMLAFLLGQYRDEIRNLDLCKFQEQKVWLEEQVAELETSDRDHIPQEILNLMNLVQKIAVNTFHVNLEDDYTEEAIVSAIGEEYEKHLRWLNLAEQGK